jgi:hypothetical protein
VVSHLAERLDVTQRQVTELQADRRPEMVPELPANQGAIPRVRCVPALRDQASAPPPEARFPSLDKLWTDPVLSAQAAALVDDLGVRMAGNNHQN